MAQNVTNASDTAHETIRYLLTVVETVNLDSSMSQILPEEHRKRIRRAAVQFTTSIIDCLAVTVEFLSRFGT
jgi:hypothetical protein